MLDELSNVVLTTDIEAHGLRAGDIGTIVLVHAGGAAYEVEFVTLAGDTLAVLTLPAERVRPVDAGEIAHVRSVRGQACCSVARGAGSLGDRGVGAPSRRQ
jgi:hypothetical protein